MPAEVHPYTKVGEQGVTEVLVRPATGADRDAIALLGAEAFSLSADGPWDAAGIDVGPYWIAEVGGRPVATAAGHALGQHFGGRALAARAVRSVAVATPYRGSGVGSALLSTMLREFRATGAVLSVLYPSVPAPYRKLGYELAGDHQLLTAPARALPRRAAAAVRAVEEGDLDAVRACYCAAALRGAGALQRTDAWWSDVVLARQGLYGVLVTEQDAVTGYAWFTKERSPGADLPYYFDVRVRDWAALTATAYEALSAALAAQSGLGVDVTWPGRTGDALSRAIGGQVPRVAFSYPWMLRLLDVEAALSGRGYPSHLVAEVVLEVTDEVLPQNAATYRLRVEGGAAGVSRTSDSAHARLDVGALATAFTGYLTASELLVEGRLDGSGQAVAVLDAAFAGPRPFLAEMF